MKLHHYLCIFLSNCYRKLKLRKIREGRNYNKKLSRSIKRDIGKILEKTPNLTKMILYSNKLILFKKERNFNKSRQTKYRISNNSIENSHNNFNKENNASNPQEYNNLN